MTAETIAKALGGRRVGADWMARCPAHIDRKPSLSIRDGEDGKVLIFCHAGCHQAAVIRELRARGLRSGNRQHRPPKSSKSNGCLQRRNANQSSAALDIWRTSKPATGTLAEAYLRARRLSLHVPPALRFHPNLRHRASGGIWPAMIALVTRGTDGAPLAVHRTFLAHDGSGKAPVEPARMMLGPCRGGAVRLAEVDSDLMVGEGIETCLTVMQATGRPAWAALSTSGLCALDLPEAVREVIVLADGDEPGEAAANECAQRWKREGRHVRIARPPQGQDFNDVLLGRVPRSTDAPA